MFSRRIDNQAGFTLVELIIFIVVVGISAVSILSVYRITAKNSVEPILRKQAQSIASSLLSEILSHAYTHCDPSDDNAEVATRVEECATLPEALGPEPGESRFVAPQFNNVNDYHGYTMNPVVSVSNTPLPRLKDFRASVSITPVGAVIFSLPSNDDVLQINVTVTGPGISITETGYRFKYAPNATP